jgi:hypothetical protein
MSEDAVTLSFIAQAAFQLHQATEGRGDGLGGRRVARFG